MGEFHRRYRYRPAGLWHENTHGEPQRKNETGQILIKYIKTQPVMVIHLFKNTWKFKGDIRVSTNIWLDKEKYPVNGHTSGRPIVMA